MSPELQEIPPGSIIGFDGSSNPFILDIPEMKGFRNTTENDVRKGAGKEKEGKREGANRWME
jgi:hypothetical protein